MHRDRLAPRGGGDTEVRQGVGGTAVVVLRSFTFVSASPQTSDLRTLIYDSLAHSEAHNFHLIPPREIRTMILPSTCLEATPKTARTKENAGREKKKNDDFTKGSC